MDRLISFQDYLSLNFASISKIDTTSLESMVMAIRAVAAKRGTLWIAGNGGSAATASHCVADFIKTTSNFEGTSIRTIALHELSSLSTAFSNDVSFEEALGLSLESVSQVNDALLIISVSGLSPNLLFAHSKAKDLGLKTFALVGARGKSLANDCDASLVVPSEDYQVVENAHVVIMHWLTKCL